MAASQEAFGPYRLCRRLNDAEVGEALLAKRIGPDGFEKRVVIRRVRWQAGRRDRHFAAMVSEANAAALLSHANIAHLLDFGARGPWCFVATEHVGGSTLADCIDSRRRLSWTFAAHIVSEAARGLAYVHQRRRPSGELLRLVHRRITPRRIALSPAGDVKVTGFGTSWAWVELEATRSPEARRNEPVDGRADVFALGAALRRSLSSDDAPIPVRRVIEHATHDYPEHRLSAAELHEALSEVLHASGQRVCSRDIATLVDDLARNAALRSA